MNAQYEPTQDIQDKLKQLEERFKRRLIETERLIQNLRTTSTVDNNTIDELIHISHKLAGSAGTFGLAQLSLDMKKFEIKLMNSKNENVEWDNITLEPFYQEALDILSQVIKS